MEYAATITINPLTALRMLEDFVDLKKGAAFLFQLLPHNFVGVIVPDQGLHM